MKRPRSVPAMMILAVLFVVEGCAGRHAPTTNAPKPPAGGSSFTATAYCSGKVTATGTAPKEKTVAADPSVLPLGARIRLTGLDKRYNGVYVVRDTGGNIRGHRIDLYMRDCHEAVRFGRRAAKVAVLR